MLARDIFAHSLPVLSRFEPPTSRRVPFGNDATIFPAGSTLTLSAVPVGSSTLHDNAVVGLPPGLKMGVDGYGAGLFEGGCWPSVALDNEKNASTTTNFDTDFMLENTCAIGHASVLPKATCSGHGLNSYAE